MSSRGPLFHRAHYNIIAAQLKTMAGELAGTDDPGENAMAFLAQVTLQEVALRLAKRFAEDNPNFDPLQFLDACSPDSDLYPYSELWEEREEE
jgi:hypothetical protein